MKTLSLLAILITCFTTAFSPAVAQKLTSGIIHYEGMHKLDPSQIHIVRNGDVVQPGGPDAPDIPDVITFSQKLFFSGNYAKEERENPGPIVRRFEGSFSTQRPIKVPPPFIENHYLDVESKKYIQTLEIKKDAEVKVYQAEEPVQQPAAWQETSKTKKIAGYTCRKVTCDFKGEMYTIWYTTDLGFTYSPIRDLTPAIGVVLQIEGSTEGFTATRVESKAIPDQELKPRATTAQVVSAQQLEEIRSKALADFRQRMFSNPLPD